MSSFTSIENHFWIYINVFIWCFLFVVQSILTMADNENLSSSQDKFSSFTFLGYSDLLCSVFVGVDLFLTLKWRQTGNFFQTPKLNQTVSLVLRNLGNMFACWLVVLASVILFLLTLVGRSAIFLRTPRGVLHWRGQLCVQEYFCPTRALH